MMRSGGGGGPPIGTRIARACSRFLAGWGFPAFALFTLAFATVLLALMVFLPTRGTPLEQFADTFRLWCCGYDPHTGTTQWAYTATMLSSPVLLAGIVLAIWWEPLKQVVHQAPRRLWRAAVPAALVVTALSVGLLVLEPAASASVPAGGLAFPAKALRMNRPAPAFDLVDQQGQHVSLASLRGDVVVITGVYSRCVLACPLILGQAKRAVNTLPADLRSKVVVLAITFDPEHDEPAVLAKMAKSHEIAAPRYHLLTGPPALVNDVLDRYGFRRERDPKTGVINHANLFFVVDRRGRIAYRFSLSKQQEAWLGDAIRLLARERVPSA